MRREIVTGLLVVGFCAFGAIRVAHANDTVIYVDAFARGADDGSSWSNACWNIQDALALAAESPKPVEIRVAQGVYDPYQGTDGQSRCEFQLINGVTLAGGYAGITGLDPDARDTVAYETVLDGLYPGMLGPSFAVVTAGMTDETAVIDGFTIINCGSGIYIKEGCPTIRRVLFTDTGHGVYVLSGAVSLSDCIFFYNEYGVYTWEGDATLANCDFDENGYGLHTWEGQLTLTDCTFSNNVFGGVTCYRTVEMDDCWFEANESRNGAVVQCDGALTARRCTFDTNYNTPVWCEGDSTFVNCQFLDNATASMGAGAISADGYTLTATGCVFAGNWSQDFAGAVWTRAIYGEFSHCLFTGNTSASSEAGAIRDSGYTLDLSNCTFADNRGEPRAIRSSSEKSEVKMTGCIVWDGTSPFSWSSTSPPTRVQVSYCDIEGGHEGEGNINIDPQFVELGYWVSLWNPDVVVDRDYADALWIQGNYHLKSQAGHWDPNTSDWIYDETTSPCIDAADPSKWPDDEPFPNGAYVNMGAYGNTAQASRTYFGDPVCEEQMAGDVNGDCVVDETDAQLSQRPLSNEPKNVPPMISILSPADGAEIKNPDPIAFACNVSDPDGRVVMIRVEMALENGGYGTSTGVNGVVDGERQFEFDWSRMRHTGVFAVKAIAVDDRGARTSQEITITLDR